MSFQKNKYVVLKQTISYDMATFLYNYFLMKRRAYDTCKQSRYFPAHEVILGCYERNEEQVPNTYACYADIVMEALMVKYQPIIEKTTELKLQPAYTYARLYKKEDVLKRHKDRFSCEISTTMNLGGDKWDLYLEPSGKENMKGIKVELNPGDMLVYRGCELEHWRNKFEGRSCGQVFFHYNNKETPDAEYNLFDQRPHLGLPQWFKYNSYRKTE